MLNNEMQFGPRLPIVPPSSGSAVVRRSQAQQVRSLGRISGGLHGGECSEKDCSAGIYTSSMAAMGDPSHSLIVVPSEVYTNVPSVKYQWATGGEPRSRL